MSKSSSSSSSSSSSNSPKFTPKQIRERREKISHLLVCGYNQGDIMRQLGITRRIYNMDLKNIHEKWTKEFYEIAKANPITVCSEHVNELDKIRKECWKMYNDNDKNVDASAKLLALKTISELNHEISDVKLSMFQDSQREHDLT